MLQRTSYLLFATLLLFAGSAMAEIRAGSYTLSPQVGYLWLDDDLDLDDDPMAGIGFGYNYNKNFGTELFLGYAATEQDVTNRDVDVWLYRMDALYHFMPEQKLVPYLAAGVGGITFDPSGGGSDTDALLNWGGGVKAFFHENLALRLDVRQLINLGPSETSASATVGLEYQFGGEKKMVAAPAPAPAPKPAPAPAPKPAPVPAPVVKDSDGDGVPDNRDKCPDTAKGIAVDADGCPLQLTLKIEFDFDKAVVKPEYRNEIKKAGEFIRSYPQMKILVAGHTDSKGSDVYNQKLSQQRAEAVRQALIKQEGVDERNIVAIGYGEGKPVATNETDEGRQRNRRVEIICCTILPER